MKKDETTIIGGENIHSTKTLPKTDEAPPSTATVIAHGEETSSTASLFGQADTPSTASLFGQVETPSTASLFGQAETPSTASLFEQEETPSAASLFGQTQ